MKSIKLELIKLLIFKEHLIKIEKMQSINFKAYEAIWVDCKN